jgi:hypothetical protein
MEPCVDSTKSGKHPNPGRDACVVAQSDWIRVLKASSNEGAFFCAGSRAELNR